MNGGPTGISFVTMQFSLKRRQNFLRSGDNVLLCGGVQLIWGCVTCDGGKLRFRWLCRNVTEFEGEEMEI